MTNTIKKYKITDYFPFTVNLMDKNLIRQIKQSAHHLKPIVLIGQKGLTDAIILETDQALKAHECIKIKISGWEKADKLNFINELCLKTQSTFISMTGHIAIIYRKKNVPEK